MEVPHPSVVGVNLSMIIIKVPEEYHLQQMVDKKLVNYPLEWKLWFDIHQCYVFRCENNPLIDTNQSNIDVEKDCDECEPVQVLAMIVNEITLIPILHVALVN